MSAPVLDAPVLPQVDLLPPEIRSARTLGTLKRWLAIAVLGTVVVAALGYLLASVQQSDADAMVAEKQAETDRLLTAQLAYSEVPRVLGRADLVRAARAFGMSTEVLWADYLDAIVATAPPGVTVETIGYTGASPLTAAVPPTNVLLTSSVGTVTLIGRAPTVPDVAAWMAALDSIHGLRDSWVSTTEVSADGTTPYYAVTSSVQVDAGAYALRFSTDQQKGDG